MADFETYNRSKGLTHSTINWYSRKLRDFHTWLDGQDTLRVSPRTVRHYIADKMSEGLKPATVRGYFDALRAFYTFLVADVIIEETANPMRRLSPPRVPQEIVEPLTEEQVRELLAVFNRRRITGHRNYIMCLLMLDTGLRVSEVARLTIGDVNFETRRLKVWGKGNKRRWAYMGTKLAEALGQYLQYCRPDLANGKDMLFPSWGGRQMASRSISRIMQRHFDRAQIPRANSSAHRLRHTFAVNLLRNGANVFCLQRLLGHSSLSMTKRYVMLADEDLARSHAMASPVDRMIV